jgi:DNA-binding response OmpR family regulator
MTKWTRIGSGKSHSFLDDSAMSPRQLLLIDDEPAFGRFVAEAAAEAGYVAHITTTAGPFKHNYVEIRPHVVALDLAIPGVDGVELLRFLGEQKCTAPVIIISGFDRRVIESSIRLGEALGLNMAGQLTKPVRLDELVAILDRCRDMSPA